MRKMSETTKRIISHMAFIKYTIPNHENDSAAELLMLYENIINMKIIRPNSDYLIKTFNEIYGGTEMETKGNENDRLVPPAGDMEGKVDL